jgi:hypothetical protein
MLSKKISFDEKVAKLSIKAALLYTWCIPHCDVEGRMYAEPEIVKGMVVPYIKELTIKVISDCIKEMEEADLILLYGNEHKYMEFKGFDKNQTLNKDREADSEIPEYNEVKSKSGVSPEQLTVNTIQSNTIQSNINKWFLEIVSLYPNKDGSKEALRHFKASVKTEKDFADIKQALQNYLKSERVAKGFIKNCSTWFNNWRDYIDVKSGYIEDKFDKAGIPR